MAWITVEPGGERFECAEGDTILRAALRTGLGMSYSCNVGSCGNCRFELIAGSVAHARADSPAWSERDLKRNRWLGCQAMPDGDCTIKFRADPAYVSTPRPGQRHAVLESATPITADITEFTLRIDGSDGFHPGQYALLSVPHIAGGRPYSMSNLPGTGLWQFQIRRVRDGAFTGHLFDVAKPGDTIQVDGPYGTAYLDTACDRDLILMAGGSGLSPMVSIARGAAAAGMLEKKKLHFFYGCRTQADLFDAALLADLGANVYLTTALSDPDPAWGGQTGFLHDVVGATFGDTLKDHEIYFAGPAVMSTAIQKMAHAAGTPMTQLHFDEFY
jgi:toluene monooxygenase electron transfer component